MKALFIFLLSSLFFIGCKDKPEPNVAALLIGDWKLTHYKMENQAWKDSTGQGYDFINDTLVNTIKRIGVYECNRKYSLSVSGENFLKQVIFPTYESGCFSPIANPFDIISISNDRMEITYLDEVAGVMVRKYERYQKE